MSADAKDARRFFEQLYRGKPEGSVIVITAKERGRFGKSHFVRHPDGAVYYVLDKTDVYVRITPIARELPGRERGKAEHSVALPGVWAEFDVNGGPDGKGGVIRDAFPDLDAARAVATAVLQPTMLIGSGYGLQGHYLFEEMLRLTCAEDHANAKLLVQGFQERLRREAQERFGVRKLDATHDLARVFRPPGSLNGKGQTPQPVKLLDDGDRRYSIEEIKAVAIEIEVDGPPPTGATSSGDEPDVEKILARHEDLARLVARQGRKPGDGSPSTWDYQLGCRAAEHGYDDPVLKALMRYARNRHGEAKGERDDYLDLTLAAIRKRVGYVSTDSTLEEVLAELTTALRMDQANRRVVKTHVAGHGISGSAALILDDGYRIEFEQFAHVAAPDKLADQLATTVGVVTEFSKLQARRVAKLVRQAASRIEELYERQNYVQEARRLLRVAETVEFDFATQRSRWDTWQRLDATDPDETPEGPDYETTAQRRNRERKDAEAYARRMLIPQDTKTGVRFVDMGWFQQFIRLRLGPSSTPQKAKQAMLRSGWTVRNRGRIKASDPDSDRELEPFMYLVPKGWEAREV